MPDLARFCFRPQLASFTTVETFFGSIFDIPTEFMLFSYHT
jgi:hypothetical protein